MLVFSIAAHCIFWLFPSFFSFLLKALFCCAVELLLRAAAAAAHTTGRREKEDEKRIDQQRRPLPLAWWRYPFFFFLPLVWVSECVVHRFSPRIFPLLMGKKKHPPLHPEYSGFATITVHTCTQFTPPSRGPKGGRGSFGGGQRQIMWKRKGKYRWTLSF